MILLCLCTAHAFGLATVAYGQGSAPWVGETLDHLPCDGGMQGFGPYDYTRRLANPKELWVVEYYHFTANDENLIETPGRSVEGGLNYTLRAWPNHAKALMSIIRFQLEINKKLRAGKLTTPPECYLQRAIHFSPKDITSYSLYGYYLKKLGRLEEAATFYEKAIKINPENSKIAYSYGSLLIDLKRYDEAVNYAKIAYRNPHAPKELKQKLEKLDAWKE